MPLRLVEARDPFQWHVPPKIFFADCHGCQKRSLSVAYFGSTSIYSPSSSNKSSADLNFMRIQAFGVVTKVYRLTYTPLASGRRHPYP